MMSKLKKFSIAILIVLSLLIAAPLAFAVDSNVNTEIVNQLTNAGGAQGAGIANPVDPRVMAMMIFRVFAGLITIILVGINVYAGYIWMTAGGNEEEVTKAKALLRNAIIGLVIVLSAYSITVFAANLARGYQAPYMEGGILGLFGFH